MPDKPELECTPSRVRLRCGGAPTTVRVRTPDKKANVDISLLGADWTKVEASVNPQVPGDPKKGKTNADGYIDVTVRCIPGSGCDGSTDITFDGDNGDYKSVTLTVVCDDFPRTTGITPALSTEISEVRTLIADAQGRLAVLGRLTAPGEGLELSRLPEGKSPAQPCG